MTELRPHTDRGRSAVSAAWGVPEARQRLLLGGLLLDPARDVDSYCGLSHEAVVKLWPVAECSAR